MRKAMTFGKFAFRDCFSRTIILLRQSRTGHNILGHLMRKLSIAFIALFIISMYYNVLPAHAQNATEQVRISAIKVSGNRRVAEGTVLSYLPVQIGDVVSQGGLSQSLERLFATNLFKDIKLDFDGSVLTVTIVENPIINRVNIEGNDVISDEKLLQVIDVQPRRVYNRQLALDASARLLDVYRAGGRFAAFVEPKIIELNDKSDAQSAQQLVRWVNNKEIHADKIIATISNYFLTQRVKPSAEDYLRRLSEHHRVILLSMKVKQKADAEVADDLRQAVEALSKYYPSH